MDEPYTIRDLARWWEGEGCVYTHGYRLEISGTSTDREVLEHIQQQFGGSVGIKRRGDLKNKPCWTWVVQGVEAVRLLKAIYPFVFSRRRSQIDLMLRRYDESRLERTGKADRITTAATAHRLGKLTGWVK